MLGHSHLLLAGAAYTALAVHPAATPLGALAVPVLSGSAFSALPGDLSVGLQPTGLPTGTSLGLPLVLSIAVAAIAGLAPDIDKSGSEIARSLGLLTRATAWMTQRALGHRGPLHSGLAVVAVYLGGSWLGQQIGLAGVGAVMAFGWAVHLLADALTRRGVPLLWPLLRAHFHVPPGIVTGGRAEALVVLLGMAACVAWITAPLLAGLPAT